MTSCKIDSKQFFRIAPKWKFLLFILVASLSFMINNWQFYLAHLLLTFSLTLLSNISYKQLLKPIGSSLYLLIIMFGMHALWGNWVDGIQVIFRFCNLVIFTSWILLTTSSSDIIEGLTALLNPLSYFGVKPAKISLAFALAIRFIPLIIDTFKKVKMAQKAKGIDKNFIALLIPSIIKTIKMADDIAEAIEARCWE